MICFRFGRLEVQLHWSFLLLVGGAAALPNAPLVLLGLGAAACHELGHLGAMVLAGLPPARLRLGLFGGRLQSSAFAGRRAELLCLGAGPGVNLLLAAVFASAGGYGPRLFSAMNLVLGGFNLLPVQGLDGGRMLGLLLPRRLGQGRRVVLILVSLLTLAGVGGWCFGLARAHPGLPLLRLVVLVPAAAFFRWLKD